MPVLNEARNLPRSLGSIAIQDFPTDRVEVLVADGGSTDGTRDVVDSFAGKINVHVLDNSEKRQAAWGKAMAIAHASGDLIQLMDADVWFTSPNALTSIVRPLSDDPSLAGVITPYQMVPGLSVWSRFLSLDEFQRDPLYERITPNIDSFVVERGNAYDVCRFGTIRIPPIGQTTTYWRRDIDCKRWGGLFIEDDQPIVLIKQGKDRFAYVNGVGFGHDHCRTLLDLLRKRARNLQRMDSSWLLRRSDREYRWLDTSDRREVLRLVRWIVGTHLIVPRLIEGIDAALTHRRWEPLLRPIVALAVVDTLVVSMWRSPAGRRLLREGLRAVYRS